MMSGNGPGTEREGRPGLGGDDAVDDEVARGLEVAHRPFGERPEDAVLGRVGARDRVEKGLQSGDLGTCPTVPIGTALRPS